LADTVEKLCLSVHISIFLNSKKPKKIKKSQKTQFTLYIL
jgi:hypothetical protein